MRVLFATALSLSLLNNAFQLCVIAYAADDDGTSTRSSNTITSETLLNTTNEALLELQQQINSMVSTISPSPSPSPSPSSPSPRIYVNELNDMIQRAMAVASERIQRVVNDAETTLLRRRIDARHNRHENASSQTASKRTRCSYCVALGRFEDTVDNHRARSSRCPNDPRNLSDDVFREMLAMKSMLDDGSISLNSRQRDQEMKQRSENGEADTTLMNRLVREHVQSIRLGDGDGDGDGAVASSSVSSPEPKKRLQMADRMGLSTHSTPTIEREGS